MDGDQLLSKEEDGPHQGMSGPRADTSPKSLFEVLSFAAAEFKLTLDAAAGNPCRRSGAVPWQRSEAHLMSGLGQVVAQHRGGPGRCRLREVGTVSLD